MEPSVLAVVSEVFTFKNEAKREKMQMKIDQPTLNTRLTVTGELLGDFVGFAEGVNTGCFEVGSPPIEEGEG